LLAERRPVLGGISAKKKIGVMKIADAYAPDASVNPVN